MSEDVVDLMAALEESFGMHDPCGLCGRKPALGSASVWQDHKQVRLCHPDEGQDCYHLWTVYYQRPMNVGEDRTATFVADGPQHP